MNMIDYEATLKMFFEEVKKYLTNLRGQAKDKVYLFRINAAIDVVERIAANPAKYGDYRVRCEEYMEKPDIANAFIPAGTNDNTVYLSYAAVLNSMADLYVKSDYKREQAQKKLLASLKTLKYKNSKNAFKDFVFAFKSPQSFAVQSKKQYQI